MAIFNVDFPEDLMSDLLDTEFADIAEEALSEAAPILEKAMKTSGRAVIIHEGDSEMIESIKAGKPKATKTDAWIVNVGPKGNSKNHYYQKGGKKKRAYPVSNALKAIWKEYGIPGRQPPRPFMEAGKNAAQNAVIRKIQEVYNKKVGAK
ncbi:MAG: hypothetical protein HDR71_12320 [Lachnospiraceae bacterium]|nr:hypothetical protein [Lachnospiraceae bacterium]